MLHVSVIMQYCPSVTGLFHFMLYPPGSYTLLYVAEFPSFLSLNNVSVPVYTTFSLSIHSSMDIYAVSTRD